MYIANATHNEKAHYSKAVLNFCCGAVIKITSPAYNVHLHRKIRHVSQIQATFNSIVPTVFISCMPHLSPLEAICVRSESARIPDGASDAFRPSGSGTAGRCNCASDLLLELPLLLPSAHIQLQGNMEEDAGVFMCIQ